MVNDSTLFLCPAIGQFDLILPESSGLGRSVFGADELTCSGAGGTISESIAAGIAITARTKSELEMEWRCIQEKFDWVSLAAEDLASTPFSNLHRCLA